MRTTVRRVCVAALVIGGALLAYDVQNLMAQGGKLLQIAALIATSVLMGVAMVGLAVTFAWEGK